MQNLFGWQPGDRTTPRLLLLLFVLALGLRLVSITWGLPLDAYTNYYHPDEKKVVDGAVAFPADIWTREDLRYPTLVHYAVGTLTLPLRWAAAEWPGISAGLDLFLAHFLVARLLSVLLGALTVLAVYRLARRMYTPPVGLVAAALITVAGYHVLDASMTTLDVASSFFAVIALDRCYSVVRDNRRRNYVWMAVASGLLIGTKYPGAVILVPAFLAHATGVWCHWQPPAGASRLRQALALGGRVLLSPDLALYLAATVLVFLFTTPAVLVNPRNLVESVGGDYTVQSRSWGSRLNLPMWLRTFRRFDDVVGLPLALVAFLGVVRSLVRPRPPEILLLGMIIPYYLFLTNKTTGRYTIILLPAFCILAARLLVEIWDRRERVFHLAGGLAVLVVWASTLGYALLLIATRLAPDARTEAAHFIAANVVPDSSICVGNVGNWRDSKWEVPRVSGERYHVTNCLNGAEYAILTSRSYGKMEQALTSDRLKPGYVWDADAPGYWLPDPIPQPSVFQFYDEVLNHKGMGNAYDLVAQFESPEYAPIEWGAPTIRLYRRAPLRALPHPVQHPVEATLGDGVRLLGYDLETAAVKPGDGLRLTLYWQARGKMDTSYTVFTHLLDAQGAMRGQEDSVPGAGTRPTTNWVEGEIIVDTYVLPVNLEAVAGPHTLQIGMYDVRTMQRVPAFDATGARIPDDAIRLGQVEVVR